MVGRRESTPALRVCFGPPRDRKEPQRGLAIVVGQGSDGTSYAHTNVV